MIKDCGVFRSTKKIKNVAIIGAGASGLITLYHLKKRNIKATVYEQNSHVGGIWKINEKSPLYDELITNLPRQIMGFSEEFPFDSKLPSFIGHRDMCNYLHDFSVSNGLMGDINFNCNIVHVEKRQSSGVVNNPESQSEGAWTVQYRNRTAGDDPTDGCSKEHSDVLCEREHSAVVVCNGHFNHPISPIIDGLEHFGGVLMHSARYRHADELLEVSDNSGGVSGGDGLGARYKYRQKRIVIVGAKSSATDIARELAAVAGSVHVSDRNCVASYSYAGTDGAVLHSSPGLDGRGGSAFHYHPGISHVDLAGRVVCTDGCVITADIIIFCTGYEYEFPFFPTVERNGAAVVAVENRSVRQLFQHLYCLCDPTLAFVGLNHTIIPFPVFNYQAMHIAAAFDEWCVGDSDSALLPSLKEREAALKQQEEALVPGGIHSTDPAAVRLLRNYHHLGGEQWDYMRMLVSQVHGSCTGASEQRIRLMAAVYAMVSASRPPRVGLPDDYRKMELTVDP